MARLIKYIAYFDTTDNKMFPRDVSPAAMNKVSGIVDLLTSKEYKIDIISPAYSKNKNKSSNQLISIKNGVTLRLFKHCEYNSFFGKAVRKLFFNRHFKKFLKSTLTSKDIVICYHSLVYYKLVNKLHKKIGFKLINEVEELYGDVVHSARISESEKKLLNNSDAFIFSSSVLQTSFNIRNKPFCIINGNYTYKNLKKESHKGINLLYAGTFSAEKGAEQSIKSFYYLPQEYTLYVAGFGTSEEITNIKRLCDNERIIYLGLLNRTQMDALMSKIDIGLCTQKQSASFNNSSFPSKILDYLCSGLRVVSSNSVSVSQSEIAKLITIYDDKNPQSLAEAIVSCSRFENCNQKEELEKLFNHASDEIDSIIKELE